MRRKLLLINAVLLVGVVLLAQHLRSKHEAAVARERAELSKQVKGAPPPPAPTPQPQPPVSPSNYSEVAQKMLFARDRNPTVIIEKPAPPPPPPKKPMPALPAYYGTISLGEGPIVMLSPKAGEAHQGYKVGEKIGEFKIASIDRDEITFEWEGEVVRRKLDELRDRTAIRAEAAAPLLTARTPTTPSSGSPAAAAAASNPSLAVPGDEAGDVRRCVPGDTSPAGTVANGHRKVFRDTPFGKHCYWEPVK